MPPGNLAPPRTVRMARGTRLAAFAALLLFAALAAGPAARAMPTGDEDASDRDAHAGASSHADALQRAFGPAPLDFTTAPDAPVTVAQAVAEYDAWRASKAGRAALAAVPADTDDEPWDTIEACITSEMADRNTPGASIAVQLEGQPLWAKAYGIKHEDQPDEAVDTETIFRIGSTTKMMTSAAIMQQVEAGTIDLQAPITDIITDFMVAGTWDYPGVGTDDISTHALMSHSSAFPDNIFNYFQGWSGPTTDTALGEWAADQDSVILHAPPGSFWNYSNPGFSLAGRMVELASGENYHEYMVDHLWRPLGMNDTHLLPADVLADGNYSYGNAATDPITGAALPAQAPDDFDSRAIAPAGYAFSTPTDMVAWAAMLMAGGGEVLSQASVDAMQATQIPVQMIPEQTYGYGIFIEDVFDLNVYNHGGNVSGFSSQFFWVPERGIAISILANTIQSLSRTAGCAVRAALGEEPQPDPDRSTDPATWQRYTGVYKGLNVAGTEMSAIITHEGDHLLATLPDIIAPGVPFTSTLQQAYFDTFAMDTDGDRSPDSPVTFINEGAGPHGADDPPRWLRHRGFVLSRQADLPDPTQATTTPGPTPGATATQVPVPTNTPPVEPTIEPTTMPTIMPTARPTVDIQPQACPDVEAKVSAAIRSAALANPSAINGYGERCFPSQPASPFNPLRDTLDLQNPNRPHHPIFNPLVFTCGCR